MHIRPTEKGPKVEAIGYHEQGPPPRQEGQHYWVVTSVYRVRPAAKAQYQLDTENLLTIEGPFCWHCIRRWSPELEARPCQPDD